MGASFARQWANQGYYPDLMMGYISNAAGLPVFVFYPEELLNLPCKCTCCGKSSCLKRHLMFKVQGRHRTRFADYVDYVVRKRVACGDSDPFAGFETGKSRRKNKNKVNQTREKPQAQSFKNEVSPSSSPRLPPDAETLKTDFGFEQPLYTPVRPDEIVVCGYCGKGMSPERRARILIKRKIEIAKLKSKLARSKS